ncbi:fungal fruit body lectin [Pluteus cervinus]|uniref:Fungal fruit body lectin n=1 Tax=Pluteus cervinus TaxID=181527 RepID=A0ACD3AEZ0_9AGAR|nr:fungal fruit body lectin [Pluteus cervinus]
MCYTIAVRVFQTNPNIFFHVVERTNWYYANCRTWFKQDEKHILTMMGGSGSLRFVTDTGENFIAAFGVHNYKRWGDIVTNLTNNQTGVVVNPQYDSQADREAVRDRQLASYDAANAKGRNFAINYSGADVNQLVADVISG